MTLPRYVQSAIEKELAALRGAINGRAVATFRAAAAIGGFVGAGAVDQREAEALLMETALSTGLPEREARSTVNRGLRKGAGTPRDLPSGDRVELHVDRPTPRPVPPPIYPPGAADTWAACRPVGDDAGAVAWLESRGLTVADVETWDLARALLSVGELPAWASFRGVPWRPSGHRLVVPLYDAAGELRSVRARKLTGGDGIKELASAGFEVRGLVMACPMARRVLTGDAPAWWPPTFIITEGTPDFLTWATRQSDANENGPAVLGIFSGAWTADLAARIPDGAEVILRGHEDEAGEGYMEKIAASLSGRCRIFERAGAQRG